MSAIGSLAVRLIVIFGLTALVALTTGGAMLSRPEEYRIPIGVCAALVAGIVSVAFWSAMRDVDRRR
jgi:hypothetical protein